MLFSSLLSLLSLTTFFAHTAAKSILEANTTSPQYYLRTCVLDNGSPSKNGLYVSSYHTGMLFLQTPAYKIHNHERSLPTKQQILIIPPGAGINDVVLTTKANAVTGFMNATHQQFNLGGTLATPWAFVVAGSDPYAGEQSHSSLVHSLQHTYGPSTLLMTET